MRVNTRGVETPGRGSEPQAQQAPVGARPASLTVHSTLVLPVEGGGFRWLCSCTATDRAATQNAALLAAQTHRSNRG